MKEVVGMIDSKNYSKIYLSIVTGESVTSHSQYHYFSVEGSNLSDISDSIEQKFENNPYDELLYKA